MRTLFFLFALVALAFSTTTICHAQRPGPATLEDLLNGSGRPPLKPLGDGPAKKCQPVPDQAEVAKVQELIKQAYEHDYKMATDNPEPLIQKLLAAPDQAKDPVRRYAFLISAEEAAVTGGDSSRTMELIDIRAEEFEIDRLKPRIDRLAEFLTPKAKMDPEVLAELYEHAMKTAEWGMKQDSFEQAKAAADMVASIAKAIYQAGKAKKNDGVTNDGEAKQTEARTLVKEIEQREKLFVEHKKALETLKTQPNNKTANGIAGRYYCFTVHDWKKGLACMAKGDQSDVAELAALELKVMAADKPEAKQVFELAGKWWDVASLKELSADSSAAITAHARTLYRSIESSLDDFLEKGVAAARGKEPLVIAAKNAGVGSISKQLKITVGLTSDWASLALSPAAAVEIGTQKVIAGEKKWDVEGNAISTGGRSQGSKVEIKVRLKGSIKELIMETHKGDVGALGIKVESGGKVIGLFLNEGSSRSDRCRRDFKLEVR